MNDPLISRFTAACGAAGPLDLRVDLAEGGVLAEGTVPQPFTLVGRDDACDVTLTDAEVNPRHAWLQVIGGRVFAIDLGSRTGLGWPGGTTGSGWMDVDVPVRVGPFEVRLRRPVSLRPSYFPPGYSPLQSDTAMKSRPTVSLEFRNGRRVRDRWAVNRLVTLVGRAPECKIHLTADDIAAYHCGLVLTTDGLWVVDLSGRGVVVNGERMRVSPLQTGAELWVGRFLIGVQYPESSAGLGRGGPHAPGPLAGHSQDQPASGNYPAARVDPPGEDEVPLGVVPAPEAGAGLPSSHIMADAFRVWGGGPVSHPILVSTSGSTAAVAPAPRATATSPMFELFTATSAPRSSTRLPTGLADDDPDDPDDPEAGADVAVMLLRQLGDLHAQMFAQFQQSLVLLVQLFGCLRKEQLPSVQRELARIQELNAELAQLQAEVARRAAEMSPPKSEQWAGDEVPTPLPEPAPLRPVPPPSPDSTSLHEWVMDRISGLQKERQARWQSLVGMVNEKTA